MRRSLLALISILVSVSLAHALDQAKVDAVNRAAEAFAALSKDSEKTGKPPRDTEAAVKPLLDAVFDTSTLERAKTPPIDELQRVNAWNLAVLRIGLVYILAGTGATDISSVPQTQEAIARVDSNSVTFAPEVGRYLDAQLRLQKVIVGHGSVRFVRTANRAQLDNENVKGGIAKIRAGTAQTVAGVIETMRLRDLPDDWRRGRLQVLEWMAPTASKFFVAEEAQALRGALNDLAENIAAADLKARLQKLAQQFGKT